MTGLSQRMPPQVKINRWGMRKLIAFSVAIFAAFGLAGCSGGSGLQGLESRLEEIKARPRGRIEPPPEFKPIATYSYAAHKLRSPFSKPVDETGAFIPDGRNVEPDMGRPREYLERFSLDALTMVGTISRPGGELEALIADPGGAVTRVRPGSYLGKNFGEVQAVSETKVQLVEIVPDGRDGWVERANSVSIAE
jgi:type IV pilus assembly protein PilP